MQIPIISGIYTDGGPDVRRALPRNLVPVGQTSGVSEGYLRPADGLTQTAVGPGADRGGILFKGFHVRVIGSNLCTVAADGVLSVVGVIPGEDRCLFAYDQDNLGICANGNVFFASESSGVWTVRTLTFPIVGPFPPGQDPPGLPFTGMESIEWLDNRFFFHSNLDIIYGSDPGLPLNVNQFAFGSSEIDPDPIVRLITHRKELHVINRHTIEVFQTVGGLGFPLQRIENAVTEKGAIGRFAACIFDEAIAMVGGGRNEALGVYLVDNALATKISDGEIDRLLGSLSEQEAASIVVESRTGDDQKHLYIHLPTQTLVFDSVESKRQQKLIWFTLDSGQDTKQRYRAMGWVHAFGKWWAGDPTQPGLAYADKTQSYHYGTPVQHEFSTIMMYAESQDAIVHEMELIALPGRVALGATPTVWTSYSRDGLQYSQERGIAAGTIGQTLKRLAWRTMGRILHWRIQRFRWLSDAHISVMALNVEIEQLFVRPRRG